MSKKDNEINYKNEEYKSFVNGLNGIYLDKMPSTKQYQTIQEHIKYQENIYGKEDMYTFAKRYIINNQTKDKHVDINMSVLIGAISGIFSTLITNAVKCIPAINGHLGLEAIVSIGIAIIVVLFAIPFLAKEIKTIRRTGTMSNVDMILTVLQNYCEKIENKFDWIEENIENERIEKIN